MPTSPYRIAGMLLLALAPVAAAGGEDVPAAPEEARVEVRGGRASLVQGEEVRVLTRVSAGVAVEGAAYLEVGPLSAVEVAWVGRGSLRVRGPAALEWEAGAVRVLRAERLELEVRRGERELELPGGWTLGVGRGAIGAGEGPRGDWTVEHRGGADVAIARGGEPAGRLSAGRRARLAR